MPSLVISGASKGIGRAIAIAFAGKGFDIVFCSRNKTNLEALKEELKAIRPGGKYDFFVCDMAKKAEAKAFAEFAKSKCRIIDILVNNAGVFLPGNIYDEEDQNLETMMDTNLYSAYYLTKGIVPVMISQKKGHIFNISSVAGIKTYPNGSSYSISKYAMQGFTGSLRHEMKEFGIRVTGVLPGATLTDSWAGVDLPEERFMRPEDIAKSIFDIYTLSDRTVVEEIILRPQSGDI